MSQVVRCDEDGCGWVDAVSALRHLRAWYHAACPRCGRGEVIDADERVLIEELLKMEDIGWINPAHGGGTPAKIDSRKRPFNLEYVKGNG